MTKDDYISLIERKLQLITSEKFLRLLYLLIEKHENEDD